VACLGDNLKEAFYNSWLSTEQSVLGKRILASIGGEKKFRLLPELRKLEEMGWEIFSTENTHDFLTRHGVASNFLYKGSQELEPNVITVIANKNVDLIINIPRTLPTGSHHTDGYKIRRLAIDHHIPLITNLHIAQLFLQCLTEVDPNKIAIKSWQDYMKVD
jgi:methylglyoxal synthase